MAADVSGTTAQAPRPVARRPVAPGAPRPGRRPRRPSRRTLVLWAFAAPALAVYVTVFVLPTLQAVQYSITDWDGFSTSYETVGLRNFNSLARNDDLFTNALTNNLRFTLVVMVAQTVVALGLALLLVRTTRASTLLRALFFLPTILSSVSVAFIWRFAYDPNVGVINRGLGAVGLDGLQSSFLGDPQSAIYWVALTQVWFHAGQMMTIYIAGLQAIPAELYEAAAIDGVTGWARFRHITWPLVAPATMIVVAYTTIQSFKAFDLVLGLGGNPPRPSLDILSTRIYTTFANNEFGSAAAMSLVFMALIAGVTWAQRRTLRPRWSEG